MQVDKHLAERTKAEWPGILAWMIEGCLEWQRIGLSPPKAVTDATERYLESEDMLGEWMDECCDTRCQRMGKINCSLQSAGKHGPTGARNGSAR